MRQINTTIKYNLILSFYQIKWDRCITIELEHFNTLGQKKSGGSDCKVSKKTDKNPLNRTSLSEKNWNSARRISQSIWYFNRWLQKGLSVQWKGKYNSLLLSLRKLRAHINFAHEFNIRTIDDAYGFFQCKMDEWFEIGERFINYTMEKKYANELQSVWIEFCSKRKVVVIRPHI